MFRALKFWTVIQFNILKTTYALLMLSLVKNSFATEKPIFSTF